MGFIGSTCTALPGRSATGRRRRRVAGPRPRVPRAKGLHSSASKINMSRF